MKRLLLLLLSIFCLGALKAQEVRLGAFAGVNVSTPSELRSKLGLSVGVKGELQFQNSMYFELGLSLNSKGWKSKGYYNTKTEEAKTWEGNPYYLDIPLRFGYKFSVGENIKFLGGVGPYVGLGLFGKNTYTVESKSKVIDGTASDNLFKDKLQERFDYGVGINFGVEIHNDYQIYLGYNLGLTNIYKKEKGLTDSKNRVFNVSFAYLF